MDLDGVELTDAEGDRVDRLVGRTSFDRDEAEAIVRFSKVDAADRDPETIRSYVSNDDGDGIEDGLTPVECDRIRRDMGKASRPTTVITAYPNKHPSAIFRHATGRCDHDGDVDPVTSPRIESDECRDMRIGLQTGDTIEDIRADYNRSANAVVKHVFGRCDHTFTVNRNGRELSDTVCRLMRRTYRENNAASVDDVSSAFMVGTSTAHRHLTGSCGHRDDVEAPIGPNGAAAIEEAECGRMRNAYGSDTVPSDLADRFDRDPSAVRKHVFGRCRHGGSGCDKTRDTVDAERCRSIRTEYRRLGIDTVASLVDRLNTTRGTFFYHLQGKCTHDHDVDPVDLYDSEV